MTSRLSELSKQLQLTEGEARNLRQEVSNLQATQRSLTMGANMNARVAEIEYDPQASSRNGSHSRSAATSTQRGGLALPQDFIDEMIHKAAEVDEAVRTHRKLSREIVDLTTIADNADAQNQQIEEEYHELVSLAGADEDGKSTVILGLTKRNAYAAALKRLIESYHQREALRVQLQNQSKELLHLAESLEGSANGAEQKAEAQAVLREKRAELATIRAERARLEREVQSKDHILEKKPTGPTDEEAIRSADFDRRVALHELKKESERVAAGDLAIRHRSMQIAKSVRRLEMIGDALAGNGLENEDRLNVAMLNELLAEIDALYVTRDEGNVRMDALDAHIEKSEYKVQALQQTTTATRREMAKVEKDHKRYLSLIKKELDNEQIVNDQEIAVLEEEIEALRRGQPVRRRSRQSRRSSKSV